MSAKVGRIRDVAKEAGLSVATVSRVMNGATNVKPDTRERVLDACRKLDYFPNPAARALTTNRSKSIAAIIPTIEHSVFAKYINAIENTLNNQGYSLILAISNGDEQEELESARKLLGMGADAFILSGALHHEELISLFTRRNIPFVFTSIWDLECGYPTIGYDNFNLARNAIEYLSLQGHARIAVAHGPLVSSDRTQERKAGAVAAGANLDAIDFYETELSVNGGKNAAASIASSGGGYSAVLCFSDVLALGTYFSFQEAGIKIPDEISVMGFDNLDWSKHIVPALTTIDLPAAEMGVSVANELMKHLKEGDPVSSTQLFGRIIERSSVRMLNK